MNSTNSIDTSALDKAVERIERRAMAAKQIGQILREFPDLADELGLRFSSNGEKTGLLFASVDETSPRRKRAHKIGKRSSLGKVLGFFVEHGNEWSSVPEAAESLGVSRGTIGHICWTAYGDKFEKRDYPGSNKKKQFRLTTEALAEAKSL